MAYRIIEGVPGSGKSYRMVHWLAVESGFCLQLKDGGYVLNPSKKIRVITNVAGLTIPHEDFQACLDAAGGFENFFTIEYQRQFSGDFHLLYIIDEAQEWFWTKTCRFTKENLLYFTWSRHQGHDVFLLTQNIRLLVPEITVLAEYIIHAQPRVKNVSKELTYKYRTYDGSDIRVERLLFSNKIAALYKSMEKSEVIRIKNYNLRKVLAAACLSAALMYYGGSSLLARWNKFYGSPSAPPASAAASAPAASPAAASSASAAPKPAAPPPPASPSGFSSENQPAVEFYMYRLDHAEIKGRHIFLLGIAWVPKAEFPYLIIKKGDAYFAKIPAVLLPALENSSRALPIRTDDKKG